MCGNIVKKLCMKTVFNLHAQKFIIFISIQCNAAMKNSDGKTPLQLALDIQKTSEKDPNIAYIIRLLTFVFLKIKKKKKTTLCWCGISASKRLIQMGFLFLCFCLFFLVALYFDILSVSDTSNKIKKKSKNQVIYFFLSHV